MEPLLATPHQEPSQIAVTVFSARNIQSRRKGEACHASVVFGVGKDYYLTETIVGNSPEWNQEAHINISGSPSGVLKFKVRDKEHTLGVVTVPLADLTAQKNKRWMPLQPHKKSHEVHGELQLDCYISEFKAVAPEKSPSSSQQGSTEELHGKPHKKFSFHRRTPSWGLSRPEKLESSPAPEKRILQGSGSDYELHARRSLRTYQSDTNLMGGPSSREVVRAVRKLSSEQSPGDDGSSVGEPENPLAPEVSGISPNEGPVEGNQRVILRGSNLGESRSDVVRVEIAGVDCTTSLEYFSPSKLAVTTSARSTPGSGPVIVETVVGGVATSSLQFTFVSVETPLLSTMESPFLAKKKSKAMAETEELQTEIKVQRQQIRDLKDDNAQLREENTSLKQYIDRLLLNIINTTPEILEVKSAPNLPSMRGISSSDSYIH